MQQFTFEILYHLIGIGSASGLYYKDSSLYLISDNANCLYIYQTESKTLSKMLLFGNETAENIPKKIKPDFEAIAEYNGTLYIFGSGSTENRQKMIAVDINSKKILNRTDLSKLYASLRTIGKIPTADFNIEGVVYNGKSWYFFQRGNGGTGKNGIFKVSGNFVEENYSVFYTEFELPKIGGVECSFTDAVLVDAKIYFIATAENTTSTYDDGAILGSIIGTLDLDKMKIENTLQLSDTHKLEGIALYRNTTDHVTFLLCEDNDTDFLESDIFRLQIKK